MISSKGVLSVKLRFAVVFFAFLSIFYLAILSPSLTNAYADNIEDYIIAATEIKATQFYPYEESQQASVDTKMETYIDAKAGVSSEEYDSDAEAKYTTLLTQKTNLDAYYTASNAICCIICYADSPTLATVAMTAYSIAKQSLITSYGDTYIMLYVNSNSADSKYALLLSQKSSYVTYIYNPIQPASKIYDGSEQTFRPIGFDSNTMTITNNKKTNANEAGYDVVVSLKDKLNYRWNDGTVNDLHYNFVIQKLAFTESELSGILFNSRTFIFTNTSHSVEISSLPTGLSVDHLTVNSETKTGTSFSAINAGKYTVIAHLVVDNNHIIVAEDNERLTSMELTSILTIKPLELASNSVTTSTENGFDAEISLYVLCASATEKGNVTEILLEQDLLAENEAVLSMYQAYFVKDGEEVQPDEMVTVTMLIPQAVRGVNFRLIHIHNISANVNEFSQVDFTTSGDYVTFETDTLSSFAFIADSNASNISVGSIIAIVSVSIALIILIALFVLYFLWKNYDNKKIKFLVPCFKKINKIFHGTALNDVELVEEGKKLLKKANERQKIEVEKMTITSQKENENKKDKIKTNVVANKNVKKDDKNAKNKK